MVFHNVCPPKVRSALLGASVCSVLLWAFADSGRAQVRVGPTENPRQRDAGGRSAPAALPALGQQATARLQHAYEEADQWAMKAIILLSLGNDWHPDGSAMLAEAIKGRDKELVPFGVETVLASNERVREMIATSDLMSALVGELDVKNKLLRERVLAALKHLAPDAGCESRAEWKRWWSRQRDGWVPPAWAAADVDHGEGTVTQRLVDRAFDLQAAGLEVVIIIDTTGSMQRAIDAARDAIDSVSALLAGVAPKLRLGLVHYKDFDDFGEGAKLLVPLTRDHKAVRKKLSKLTASGGGDFPERVEKGVEVALGRKTKWTKGANRMMLIVGDAPPHGNVESELVAMVKQAREQPFTTGRKGPITGKASTNNLRPFITSAIATSPAAQPSFDAIAEAGGGASVLLDLSDRRGGGRGGRGGRPGGRGPRPSAAADSGTAAERIAEHVMLLSFGAGYEAQLRRFVELFFRYRRAEAF